jgi:hypothetical protein
MGGIEICEMGLTREGRKRMNSKEAVEIIKNNWPPENYTMLREALTLAIGSLEKPVILPIVKGGAFECPECCRRVSDYCCPSCGVRYTEPKGE